jgi:ABC-2 type transport system permease protein
MDQFKAFVQKEFYHIFRDKWTMMILIALPIIMLVLFGFAISDEVKNSRIAIFDPSDDAATREIVYRLVASGYFSVYKNLGSSGETEKEFQKGEVSLIIIFSENFYENLIHTGKAQIQLIADGSDPNTAVTLVNYAENIITSYQQELLESGGIPYLIAPAVKFLYNPDMKSSYNFVPGVMGMILILICAMMTSISIAREKEMGTMEILLVSPVKPILMILAKAVPYFALSMIDLIIILLTSVLVLGVPIAGSLFWLVAVSVIFISMSLALGLLISSYVKTQLVALLISGMVLLMPVMILSGMIFPVENMPVALQIISDIVPARWYIVAVKNIMIKGLGLMSVIREMVILSVLAVFFIVVSLKNFKIRLE